MIVFVITLGYSTVNNYLVRYQTVSEVASENPTETIWVNGTIVEDSFTSLNNGEYVFVLTDGSSTMNVRYSGDLPSSLGTESDIVILGTYRDTTFHATKLIAKCPTKYKG